MLKIITNLFSRVPKYSTILVQSQRSCAFYPCPPPSPDICCSTLCNGVRIVTEESKSPLACVSLFIEAGSRYETACNNGITHFIEHMAYKGFNSMSQCDLESTIALSGSRLTAMTNRELQVFSALCPSECAPNFLELLSLIITDLEFNEYKICCEREIILQEMDDADKDPKAIVFDYLHATAFQGTPLSQRVIGPTRNVCRFDRPSGALFLCEHYQPYRFIIATSGNVVHEQMASTADIRFSCIPCDPCFESEDGPCRFTGSEVRYRDDSMPLAHVAIAFEAPGYASSDYLTMLVMSHVVGSWDGTQCRGYDNSRPLARAAALTNSCHRFESFYIPYRDVGLWGVYFVADKMHLEDMVYFIQTEWMSLCFTKLHSDLLKGMNAAKLEVYKRYASAVASSYDIGTQIMYTGNRPNVLAMCDRLAEVKVHSIHEAAGRYLYDQCPAVAALGPVEGLPDYTRIRSGMYWLRT